MSREERLFQAIGAAEAEFVAHSERRETAAPQGFAWKHWALSAAACLAVLCAAGGLIKLAGWRAGSAAPAAAPAASKPAASAPAAAPSAGAPAASAPAATEAGPSHGGGSVQGEISGDSGKGDLLSGPVHLMQLGADAGAPAFLLHLDSFYTLSEKEGKWWINPVEPPESSLPGSSMTILPWCGMTIEHRPGVSPETAAEAAAEELRATDFDEVSDIEADSQWLFLHASYGTDWDDAQVDVWVVDDRNGGCYVLTGSYFLEAAEGHGARFANMAATFQPVTEDIPDWLIDLRSTADAVSEANFAGDLTPVMDRIAYGVRVEGESLQGVSVSSVDLSVDDAENPSSAVASVRFRHLEDSYDYLTIELEWKNSRWIVTWMGLEK